MPSRRLRIMSIVGARPNMMKVAPLMAELRLHEEIQAVPVSYTHLDVYKRQDSIAAFRPSLRG